MNILKASIVITTKNRMDDLRQALRSAVSQVGDPEIIVIDDASTDGTAEMVRSEFPTIRLEVAKVSSGYIVQRNLAATIATGDVIISIDDDAEFSTSQVIQQTLDDLQDNPRIGAVAMPYREPNKADVLMQSAPDGEGVWITEKFIGTSHAVRRELFLELGGYREELIHQGEESDFAIRMLDAGYLVRLGTSEPVLHYESPKRDHARMDFYGARNSVLFAWQNVPLWVLPLHLVVTTLRCATLTFKCQRFVTRLRGIFAAYSLFGRVGRKPVSQAAYRLFRRLRKQGPFLIESVPGNPLLDTASANCPTR